MKTVKQMYSILSNISMYLHMQQSSSYDNNCQQKNFNISYLFNKDGQLGKLQTNNFKYLGKGIGNENREGIWKLSFPDVCNNVKVTKLNKIVGKHSIWVAGCNVNISQSAVHCESSYVSLKIFDHVYLDW